MGGVCTLGAGEGSRLRRQDLQPKVSPVARDSSPTPELCLSCLTPKAVPDTACRARQPKSPPTPLVAPDSSSTPDFACRARHLKSPPSLLVVPNTKSRPQHRSSCATPKVASDTVCRAALESPPSAFIRIPNGDAIRQISKFRSPPLMRSFATAVHTWLRQPCV